MAPLVETPPSPAEFSEVINSEEELPDKNGLLFLMHADFVIYKESHILYLKGVQELT